MAGLQYRTKGDSSPQGKPRVYFCCHPDDFEKYFKPISEEIWSLQSCSVWYQDGSDCPDLLADLKQMQLFVMPVTTRLLCTENDALNVEFPFAMDNHIPVLPLMQEQGLHELFNQKCGDLQFLEPHSTDATAISYEEKLKKYLASVLIGDALAEQIRAAFDAYVFLSYRKKDRKYAQELMGLIHKNDFCRDIAIWYDEFLTPGEDFNQTIQEALEKSKLFVLTVTPSLLETVTDEDGTERDNYIVTTEYPLAKKRGKPILPAELVPTDKDALSQKYQGIPAVSDAHDDAAFAEVLLQAVKNIALRKNDTYPRHNFFIGLAYLGGVDVEVNHERAVELITSAAEADLPEAMEKLVSMYRGGTGVKRDYEKAVVWQSRLVELYERISKQAGTEDNLKRYISALWKLGDYQYENRSLSHARATVERLRLVCEAANQEYYFQRNLSVSYEKLAKILTAQGELSLAADCYQKAIAIAERLSRETGSEEVKRDIAVSCGNYGDLARMQSDFSLAAACYRKSHAIREELAADTAAAQARRDLAISHCRLGDVAEAQGDFLEAKNRYEKAAASFIELENEEGAYKRDIAVSYGRLGDIAVAQGSEYQAYFEKACGICEELEKETGTIEAKRDLAICYTRLGSAAIRQEQWEIGKTYYEKACGIRESLVQQTGTIEAKRDLSLSYNKLGLTAELQNDLELAKKYYEKALKIREEIINTSSTVSAEADLAEAIRNLGDIADAQGDASRAAACYQKACALQEVIAKKTTAVTAKRNLARSYTGIADIKLKMGAVGIAVDFYEKALALRKELAEITQTAQEQEDVAWAYCKLAEARNDMSYYENAYHIWTALSEKYPDNFQYCQCAYFAKNIIGK